MRNLSVLILALAAGSVCGEKICAVYDENGSRLGPVSNYMGAFAKDAKPGNILPGELRLENFRPVALKSGTCRSDYVKMDLESNRLRFAVGEKFDPEGASSDGCTFLLVVEKGEGCPDTAPSEFPLNYSIRGERHAPIFGEENYTFQMTFPVPKGTVLNEKDIRVTNPDSSAIRLELERPFEGTEIVPLPRSADGTFRFRLEANKLLYLQEHLRLTLVATAEPWEITSKVALTLRMNEDSTVPRAEFEKSFYNVTVHASQLDPGKDIYPAGEIRLKENYERLSLDVRSLSDGDLRFKVSRAEGTRTVNIRILELPNENLTSTDVFLQLAARLTDAFGHESEGFATLLVRVIGEPKCAAIFEPDNKEHLTIAVIVLSVAVVFLILVIIYLYFKYVCVRKAADKGTTEKKKEEATPVVRHRRPTPRKISEYPYPLEKMPQPLETLAETEEDSEGKYSEVTIVNETIPTASTRKRSLTFVESDEESRQNREAPDPVSERKLSRESQEGEERRRRKSSTKMYRCLT